MSGFVWFVGAGPGSADLLTLRAAKVIGQCEILLVDDLVSAGVLEHARRGTPIMRVGKRAGRARVAQSTIDKLLVRYASAGQIVGRIKGGDPGVFGRLGEEIAAVDRAGLRFEVVPGVTAACSAAARAKIPLSLRGLSSSIALVTARRGADGRVTIDARADTVVVYMGRDVMAEVARHFIDEGRPASHPVLLVRDVAGPRESVQLTSLGVVAEDVLGRWLDDDAPVVAVIGDVAAVRAIARRAVGD